MTADLPELRAAARVERVIARWRVERIVSAHTPQPNGIRSRFHDRLFLIDSGMLASVYRGRPSALEIAGDRVTAIYPDTATVLVPGAVNGTWHRATVRGSSPRPRRVR